MGRMPSSGYRGVLCFGLAGLLHSAYSAAERRSYARAADIDLVLPLDIMLQAVAFLLVTMFGVIHIAGDFKEIRATVGQLEKPPQLQHMGAQRQGFQPRLRATQAEADIGHP